MLALWTRITAFTAGSALLLTPIAVSAAANNTTSGTAWPVKQQPAAQSPWLTLSMLSPSGAIGLEGAQAAGAVNPDSGGAVSDQAPPFSGPPPQQRRNQKVPYPVIIIWLADLAAAVYLMTMNHHGQVSPPQPNSPG